MFMLLIAFTLLLWMTGRLLKALYHPRKKLVFKGSTVVVTGGSSGLGLALATEFAKRGAKTVAIIARDKQRLDEAKRAVSDRNLETDVLVYSADATDYEGMAKVAIDMAQKKIVPEYLFCCAGASKPGFFQEQDIALFESILQLNYLGSVYSARAFTKLMTGGGKIILIGSTVSLMGLAGYSEYCPSKYALRGLAECLRQELRPLAIDVHIYFAGTIDSPGLARENETKPEITKALEGGETSDSSPVGRARTLIKGLQRGDFAISSDRLTDAIQALGNGLSLPNNLAFLLNPISAFAGLMWTFYTDYMISEAQKRQKRIM
jgi:3-dehydrosphinganine reductase